MKKKLLLFTAVAFYAAGANAQYCGGGPSSTIDSNLGSASLVGESTSISYTGCPGVTGVENQLVKAADLFVGSSYTTNLQWSTCGGSYSWAGSAWIDFDGSGTYDADEVIAATTGSGAGPSFAYGFTVPADAVEGATRMRVVQRESGSLPLDPCGSFSWGSAVEFTINISTPCSDIIVSVSDYETCEGEMVTIDGEGLGTITWTGGITDGVAFDPGVPGVYSFLPTSDDPGDCEFAPADAIVIQVYGPPVVIAGAGDLNFCVDEMVTLSAAGGADVYVWNDGAPLDLMPGIGTHTYTLTGTSTSGGCVGAEITDEVIVTVHDLPTITATASDSPICLNNEVTLSGGGGVTYTWDHGVMNGVPYTPAALGTTTYTVHGTDANGCSNEASVDVEVVSPVTITGTVTEEIAGGDGAINITVAGGAPAYTFDWDNDGTGDFDDTEDLTGLAPGEYTVVVMSDAGCGASYTFVVGSQLTVDEYGNALVNVYPNPTQDNINIELAGAFAFEIVSINGEVILSGSANDKKVVSMGDFASGIYFVNIKSESIATTLKIVKK